jgi:hypothetical protein
MSMATSGCHICLILLAFHHKRDTIIHMTPEVRAYLAEIGRRGGRRSRRVLPPETARRMVRLREARRAFKRFHARCFWSSPKDYLVTAEDIAWVARQLMTHGGREGWRTGASLCR